jgi:hypothetical protein
MNAILDTSSLLAMVRYYVPFDKENHFRDFLKEAIEKEKFFIIDKVFDEAKYQSKGIILKELSFIEGLKKKIIKTGDLLPTPRFSNRLDNDFCNQEVKKEVTPAEFGRRKEVFLENADLKMILYAIEIKGKNPIIVTEETSNANDNKQFKKIPDICKQAEINCCSAPVLFEKYFELNFLML